ncbi:3'-5'-exoribonuclease [Pyricularia oryzae]|nr:3'-5'-exoribonuclease [Pyricularia oryzae]KAI6458707.1 3'-5'-exoribonuclease [Pyricularia oryzae]KAI6460060.1 3'-5'-exoribonuclease [Pyricularia oryzae]KAI6484514.1 3'-5'-exoribonuclease [Pyricularia oryzae]KAI6487623.1 3'-5'-exoribonuclease [Pyricularia oryzae]
MTDRRRINGPVGTTLPPVFFDEPIPDKPGPRTRSRPPNAIRKIFLKTGITPSASGSAYLEIENPVVPGKEGETSTSGLKLSCTVHGPRALPRSTPFSPHIILSTHIKYAPFATKQRRGYIRDSTERDLSVHLETALRGVIIADRWPKSGVDVIVSVIEGDQDRRLPLQDSGSGEEAWSTMSVLSGCITVASAALADAGIDCVDMVAGGVAALVRDDSDGAKSVEGGSIVVDPVPAEHDKIVAACCVAYLPNRDEVTNLWFKGDAAASDSALYLNIVNNSVRASKIANRVLMDSLKETLQQQD